MSEEIKTQFLDNAKDHGMLVILDTDTHRHISFKNPLSGIYWFSLITWPGHLCITGDCGTFVFRRTDDMFSFFRSPELSINPDYWSKKVEAQDRDGVTRFSKERFADAVRDHFDSCFHVDHEFQEDIEQRDAAWRSVKEEILDEDISTEEIAFERINSFCFRGFRFEDFYEYDVNEFTNSFVWCLYAIVWGINRYDKEKTNHEPI